MAGQADNIVTLAEQPGDNAATESPTRSGDSDSHWLTLDFIWLVVVVE
jgi:hypothetical protein